MATKIEYDRSFAINALGDLNNFPKERDRHPLRCAKENLAFIATLLEIPSLKTYLRVSKMSVTIFEGEYFMEESNYYRDIVASSEGIFTRATEQDEEKLHRFRDGFLDHMWDGHDRAWVRRFGSLSQSTIIRNFKKVIQSET